MEITHLAGVSPGAHALSTKADAVDLEHIDAEVGHHVKHELGKVTKIPAMARDKGG